MSLPQLTLVFLVCWSLCAASQSRQTIDKDLKFKSDGTFKIVQFTDLHFGEGEDLDENSMTVQRTILKAEQPDLVVITGDAVSGYAWDRSKDWYKAQWEKWTSPMQELGFRWSYALGNHDDQADYSRKEIVTLDQTAEESLTQFGPQGIPGVTNFYLPVHSSNSSNVVSNLWFLDSMDDNCLGVVGWGCVYPEQVEWFRRASDEVRLSQGGTKPGLAFFHIPVPEFMSLWSNFPVRGNKTEDVCCFSVNTGLFSAFVEKRNIEAVFCGHDHNNDFYGIYNRIHLAYGRKTGYGGYGPPEGWLRGARVIELVEEPFQIKTWIRQEDGTLVTEQAIVSPPSLEQRQTVCCDALGESLNAKPSNCKAWEQKWTSGSHH